MEKSRALSFRVLICATLISSIVTQPAGYYNQGYDQSQAMYGQPQGYYGQPQGNFGHPQGNFGQSQGYYGQTQEVLGHYHQLNPPKPSMVSDAMKRNAAGLTEVEISISATALKDRDLKSKSDPMCVVYERSFHTNQWTEIHKTEHIKNNLNPAFAEKLIISVGVNENRTLMFKIFDVDTKPGAKNVLKEHDYLGVAECSLRELVDEGQKIISLRKRDKMGQERTSRTSKITVTAEKLVLKQDRIRIEIHGENLDKKDTWGLSDPYLEIYKSTPHTGDGEFVLVHRTEWLSNTLSPHWDPFNLVTRNLCNGEEDRDLKFMVWDWDDVKENDLIGVFTTTLRRIKAQETKYELTNPKKGNKLSGTIKIVNFFQERVPTFKEFVDAGLQMHGVIAIDFTSSNGRITERSSLHYVDPTHRALNQYELAITAVVTVIENYDYNKLFPVYGFGAKYPSTGPTLDEFSLIPNEGECQGVQGVLDAYRAVLKSNNITLSTPTHFAPIIRKAASIAQRFPNPRSNYLILLILTDGEITDIADTERELANAARLPMSIVIVGIGSKSFLDMERLDRDNVEAVPETTTGGAQKPAKTGNIVQKPAATATGAKPGATGIGLQKHRDIVQFVPLRNYSALNAPDTQMLLAQDVLAEVPTQLLEYMKLHYFFPEDMMRYNQPFGQAPMQPGFNNNMYQQPGMQTQGVMPMHTGIQSQAPMTHMSHEANYLPPHLQNTSQFSGVQQQQGYGMPQVVQGGTWNQGPAAFGAVAQNAYGYNAPQTMGAMNVPQNQGFQSMPGNYNQQATPYGNMSNYGGASMTQTSVPFGTPPMQPQGYAHQAMPGYGNNMAYSNPTHQYVRKK